MLKTGLCIGDVAETLNRIRVPLSRVERRKRQGPYRYYGAQGVIDHIDDYLFDGEYVLVAEDGENLRSRKQPIAFLVTGQFWVNNHAHILKVSDDVANSRFVVHAINQASVAGLITGAAQPKLTKANLESLQLPALSKIEQDRVATVLAAFDELIEINERRIELLEDLARLLYREWFVRRRFNGSVAHDIQFGDKPSGWSTRSLADLTSQLTRGVAPRYAEDGEWIVINQRCIRDGRVTLIPARRHGGPVPEAKQIRPGDVLINSTGIGTLGRVGVFLGNQNRITADSHVTIVRAASHVSQAWLGQSLADRQGEIESLGVGSTGQTELGRDRLGALRLLVPTEDVLRDFSEAVTPLSTQAHELLVANGALARTRDLLIPRLVTGQLDVSDIDLGELIRGRGG